jgi:hypothetical protein
MMFLVIIIAVIVIAVLMLKLGAANLQLNPDKQGEKILRKMLRQNIGDREMTIPSAFLQEASIQAKQQSEFMNLRDKLPEWEAFIEQLRYTAEMIKCHQLGWDAGPETILKEMMVKHGFNPDTKMWSQTPF